MNLWILSWATHALTTAPATVFHANIFYPEPYALAFSEHQLGVLPLFGPLWAISGSPTAGFDLYYLLTFVLTGLATFALVRFWTGSLPGALLAGLVFAFAPARLSHHYGTQLLAIWWLPLTLLLTERFLRRPTTVRAGLAAASFAMQWLSSIYLGWFLTVAMVIYLIAAAVGEPRIFRRASLWLNGLVAAALAGLAIVPTLIPYRLVTERWAVEWPLDHLVSHSAVPVAFLNVSPGNLLYGRLLHEVGGAGGAPRELFPGLLPLLLGIGGAAYVLKRRPAAGDRRRGLRWFALTFATIALICLVLSFGPYAGGSGGVPLPYLPLLSWVPGFHAIRNPVRFIFVVALALAVLSGLGLSVLLERVRGQTGRKALTAAVLLFATAEVFTILSAERVPSFDSAALAHLRSTVGDGPIVELPVSWERGVSESPRMVASIAHWRPLVGGFSGFKPPREALEAVLQDAAPDTLSDALQVIGVKTLVIHLDELQSSDRARFSSTEWREAGFVEQLRTDQTLIWTLQPATAPGRTTDLIAEVQSPRQIAAGRSTSVRLELHVEEGRVFRPTADGARPMQVEWLPEDPGAELVRQELRVALPLVVVPRPTVKVELEVSAPRQPGRYRLVLRGESFVADRAVLVSAR